MLSVIYVKNLVGKQKPLPRAAKAASPSPYGGA